jgi:hypothetical protein
MATRKEDSTGFVLFGLVLWAGGGGTFEAILFYTFGWQIAALPVAAFLCVLGHRVVWPPADGNAGTSGSRAGTPYVVQLDPEDPDAGVPRQRA